MPFMGKMNPDCDEGTHEMDTLLFMQLD
jgi:hypothetical protein